MFRVAEWKQDPIGGKKLHHTTVSRSMLFLGKVLGFLVRWSASIKHDAQASYSAFQLRLAILRLELPSRKPWAFTDNYR
jgi:hypothetical protein